MQEKMCLALINQAIEGKVEAYKAIEATIGEKQADTSQVCVIDELPEEAVDYVIEKLKEL